MVDIQFNWKLLQEELSGRRMEWSKLIVMHAESHKAFFPKPDISEDEFQEEG